MHIYWGGLKYMTVALPPLPEQTAIVRFLDKATANIDTAITRAHRQIALLPEYRTRLIADVVTGKLDGREVAAARPEGDPLVADTLNDTLDINTESDPDELAGPLQEAEA